MLTLIKSFRTDENTVCVMYFHNKLHQQFVVEWNNIHSETEEAGDYDLQISCLASTSGLVIAVEKSIQNGETGDCELYLAIRDTFDRTDCVDCI